MGTRGTLHVYVNDELKIRQYNQWDSYPSGQFQSICEFFRYKPNVERLAERLLNTKFLSSEDMEKLKKGEHLEDEIAEAYMKVLTDRDFGADILWAVAGMPRACRYMPDWVDVHRNGLLTEVTDDTTELPPEEGNYVIRITCETDRTWGETIYIKKDAEIHFAISGEFWEIEKIFAQDYVPSDDDIRDWEIEAGMERD